MSEVPPPATLRDAATVMLVRDGSDGMEVFMLRRSLDSDFVGGAYVFPGGAVDDADRHADLEAVCRGRSDAEASARLRIDEGGLAFWVAAVRECFEEAGVLLAFHESGDVVSFADPEVAARFETARAGVNDGTLRLVDLCRREQLHIAADRIHYFSHWITPVGGPKRFDTRFFVAAAPPEQVPLHDDVETIANLWVRPQDALDRHRAGTLDLIFPTIKNLEAIAGFPTADALLQAASERAEVPAILARIVDVDGEVRILVPGDPGYDDEDFGVALASLPMPGRAGGPTPL